MEHCARQLIGQVFAYQGAPNCPGTVVDAAAGVAIVRVESVSSRAAMRVRVVEVAPSELLSMHKLGHVDQIQGVFPSAIGLIAPPEPPPTTADAPRPEQAAAAPTGRVRAGDVFAYAGDRSSPATVVGTLGNRRVLVRTQKRRADGRTRVVLSEETIATMRGMPRLGSVQACHLGSAPACALHLAELVA